MDLKTAIEKLLAAFWDKRALEIANDPLSVDELGAPMDSIVAVESLLEIGKVLKRKIPVDEVVRNGGYESKEQFIKLVTANILEYLKKEAVS